MGVAGKHFPSHTAEPSNNGEPAAAAQPAAAHPDERIRKESWFGHLLNRPEFAAISGTVLVFIVFAIGAGHSGMFNLDGVMNWAQVSAYLGILAVGA
ncbi:MAG TPA: ABC transporter permease, partial [Paraburkholderia sp.]|nr:ABC transporter permease [Paraburkholderia sp.]